MRKLENPTPQQKLRQQRIDNFYSTWMSQMYSPFQKDDCEAYIRDNDLTFVRAFDNGGEKWSQYVGPNVIVIIVQTADSWWTYVMTKAAKYAYDDPFNDIYKNRAQMSAEEFDLKMAGRTSA